MPVWATAERTRSASWPMMAKTSFGETTRVAAAMTWASSGLPPTSCSTLGNCDLRRVPLPAARMATATRGAPADVWEWEEDGFLDFCIRTHYTLRRKRTEEG